MLSLFFFTKYLEIKLAFLGFQSNLNLNLLDTWSVAPVELTEEVSLHLGRNRVVCDGDGVPGGVKTAVTWCQRELDKRPNERMRISVYYSTTVTFLRLVLSLPGSTAV